MNDKLLQNLGALTNMVRRIAVEAGAITLQYFEDQDALQISAKNDGSPVTIADRLAEEHIEKSLASILPGVPFIGEERAESGEIPDIAGAEHFWLCDPIDGTKQYIKGEPDYTVNIGLIRSGVPVLGVIYAPAKGLIYSGSENGRAMRWNEDTDKEKEIRVRKPLNEGLTVLTNYRGKSEKFENFLESYKISKVLYLASSLKLCSIAEGRADIYPRMSPLSEWDTAAGDAILRAAGGGIADFEGNPLRYGKPGFVNPAFIANGFGWRPNEDL